MSFGIKKLIFYGILLVFIAFSLPACLESIENTGESASYTNVEYSADGKSVTLYLNGSAPVRTDRALSKSLALLGHDYFEVTFLYNDNGTNRTARAAWELGESAGVSDVYREGGIVYYREGAPVGPPASGEGSVVLFVGKKFDKTLLAVGALSRINGTAVTNGSIIDSNTEKVTFDLNPIKAGIIGGNVTASSFKTDPAQTAINYIKIGDRQFPFFYFNRYGNGSSRPVTATYEFGIHSTIAPHTAFSFYSPAIRYAGGATVQNIRPRYIQPPDILKNNFDYSYNGGVPINLTGLPAVGNAFSGTVNFSFATGAIGDTVFSIIFEVPVYAVGGVAGDRVTWYFRPGYNEYFYDLDDGAGGSGGAILIGIEISGNTFKGLSVDYSAGKNYIGNTDADYMFSLDGIIISFIDGTSRLNLLDPPQANWWNYPNLDFYWDENGDNYAADTEPLLQTTVFPNENRLIAIRVVYTDPTNVKWEARMEIEVYARTDYIDIPDNRRFVITKQNDFSEFTNGATAGDTWLIVLAESVNIPAQTFNVGRLTLFIVATRPNLELGRDGGNAVINFATGGGLNASKVFLGKWPFNEPAFAGGNVIVNEFFSVNSAGIAGGGFTAGTNMFAGNVTVDVLTGITIRGNRLGP